ncbi:arrestin domain-containing protein [Stachybotrys elegans]|uniref:Arrestin domain-containing protein n=1 Tax=Stachybotrys elegans TaxID=80388 RepID=A0A8K0WRP9_9HYPO|nr:arrestin domain-containing protein [Stachybotrys elegans]
MPSFNPFSNVTGKHSCSLFDIRLDNDFIVFRGGEHESTAQLLKGVVVLCLPTAQKIEDVHLRLIGTLRLTDSFTSASGQKIDKPTTILEHRWAPFVGQHGKSMTLAAGNYEYPFEYLLPGDTAESLEGVPEASITYRLKATVGRGKFAYDLHAYKPVRVIRTLDPAALEFVHAMSVENIWPEKIEYSIVIPRKAVCFGGKIDMEMRFTPLLKGLEIGDIKADMIESRDTLLHNQAGSVLREFRQEREVASWKFQLPKEECWQNMIEDTGQEGWVATKKLDLPKRLRQCVQDINSHGIKVRHKIRLTVALHNPDGHISELRATLPVSIFISPNVHLDEQGNLVHQEPSASAQSGSEDGPVAPPGYGEHVLDQLYADVDMSGFRTPGFATPGFASPGMQSGVNSPLYAQSRTGSVENLAAMADSMAITPAALQSRLANVSLDPSNRTTSYMSVHAALSGVNSGFNSGMASPTGHGGRPTRHDIASGSRTRSNSHSNSGEDMSGRTSPDHLEIDLADLSRVPSYATAVRTPARSQTMSSLVLPDYITALSTPRTPPTETVNDPLSTITEGAVSNDQSTGVVRPLSMANRSQSASDIRG